jgi:peptide/nickel transport system substrate-binding protein
VTQRIGLGGARLSALAFGRGSLWVADATDESLLEIDPASGALRRTLTLSVHPTALAVNNDAVWVADYDAATVSEVDMHGGNILATTHVGTGPTALVMSHGNLWVASALDSTVSRVDVHTGTVTATIPIASRPTSIIADGRWVWVATRYPGSVSRIDPRRGVVLSTTPLGGSPTAVAAAGGQVWLGIQSLAEHRGGTITLVHTRPITLDPALQGDLLPPVSDGLTRDGLVTYDHVQGPAGTQLVPDLAVGVPVPTSGGTIYRFRLRPGIRYSDGRLVRAADFRRAIERAFRLGAPASDAFVGVIGATACTRLRCDLSSGIVTDQLARTVSFHLRAPDPDLLSNLTLAAASPVPPGAPWHRADTEPIPGTGPYMVVEANTRRIVWTRNPFFHEWSHAARPDGNPDRIVMRFGLQPEQEVREVEAGRADALLDNIPARLLRSVRTRHASQMHSYVIPTTDFVQFNTTRPPFDDVRVRRALNLAIDRRAIVRLYGGSALATPTCQVLPPGAVGYRRYCPYTRGANAAGVWRGPDLARARRLVDASGTGGQAVTVWGWTDDPTISADVVRYVASVLRGIGYRARVHLVKHATLEHPAPSVFRRIQLIPAAWGEYTSYGFVATWFGCRGSQTHGWFCDPRIDRMNAKARSLRSTDPHTAAALWSAIDRDLVDRAAWLPMINERGIDYLSDRVTNYQSHPYWGLLADQLWVQHS